MKKKIAKTDEFLTLGSDAREYVVIEYTEFTDISSFGNVAEKWAPTPNRYLKLPNGDHVNALDDGTFQILRTGIHLSRLKL